MAQISWVERVWVEGDIVLKSHLDELSDNFNALALHDHSGGSGSGTRALGGSAIGLISVYMRDGAGPGTPTGTISAVFTTGSRLAMHSSGGTVVMFATAGHEHSASSVQAVTVGGTGVRTTGADISANFYITISDSTTTFASTSIAIGGTGRRAVMAMAHVEVSVDNENPHNATGTVWLRRDGTLIASGTWALGSSQSAGSLLATLQILASGTYVYALTGIRDNGGLVTVRAVNAQVHLREISVP